MSTVADQRTSVPSGLLAGSWAFAIRIWIALVIALSGGGGDDDPPPTDPIETQAVLPIVSTGDSTAPPASTALGSDTFARRVGQLPDSEMRQNSLPSGSAITT